MRGRALKNPRTKHTGRVPLYLYYSLPTITRASGRDLTTDVCVLLLRAPQPGDLPWLPLVSSSSHATPNATPLCANKEHGSRFSSCYSADFAADFGKPATTGILARAGHHDSPPELQQLSTFTRMLESP